MEGINLLKGAVAYAKELRWNTAPSIASGKASMLEGRKQRREWYKTKLEREGENKYEQILVCIIKNRKTLKASLKKYQRVSVPI